MRTAHDLSAWTHSHRFESGQEKSAERRTKIALGLNIFAMIAEVLGGIVFNSMALQADGWHMFTHVGALGLAAFAYGYARRHVDDPAFVFGTGKVSALSGYSSALVLFMIAGMIVWESISHLISPEPIAFAQALPVAGIGILVNLVTAFVLGGGHDHGHEHHDHHDHHDHDHGPEDQNLKAAYVHVLGDTVTSVLAIVALLAGRYAGLWWMDPLMGCVGAVVIASWSLSLIKGSGAILLDFNDQLDLRRQVSEAIEVENDCWVADLHLWRVSPNHHAAIVSVVTHTPKEPAYYKGLLASIEQLSHITVEVQQCVEPQCRP